MNTKLTLNFNKMGQGPAVIVLHGLYGSGSNWRTIAKELAQDFTIYTLDARNHGDSPWADSMDYLAMADDVIQFLDDHQLEQAHVIGHSMGGKTAMTLAIQHPDRVNRLIVADIAPRAYSHYQSHQRYIDTMLALNSTAIESRKQAQQYLAERINEPAPVLQFLLQNLIFKQQRYQWRINLTALKENLDAIMGNIAEQSCPVPALFLGGEQSDYIQPEDEQTILTQFPQAKIETIENAGHWLHAEQPVQFIKKSKQFLLS